MALSINRGIAPTTAKGRGPLRLLLLICAALLCAAGAAGQTVQRRGQGQEAFVKRAVFGAGELWLLTDAGAVSTIRPGSKARRSAELVEPAFDICIARGEVEALTCAAASCENWALRRWHDHHWLTVATLSSQGDTPLSLYCGVGSDAESDGVLTNRRLIEARAGQSTEQVLSAPFSGALVTSVHATEQALFVGLNEGEWGGGLRRIERKTGKVSIIEQNDSGEPCGGPLNTECDPVNAIVDDPWRAGCVLAAIGLVHFEPHGRIIEVCGAAVRRVYFRLLGKPSAGHTQSADDRLASEAFFGLICGGGQCVASGTEGVSRLNGALQPVHSGISHFERIGGLGVSFEMPDVIVVQTEINRRRSVSGRVPLLVPRE